MTKNPCPKCQMPRKNLTARCSKCGWSPEPARTKAPEIAYPADSPVQAKLHRPTRRWRWFIAWIVIAGAHFLIVWWSVENTSGSFWMMEGQRRAGTLIEEIAGVLTLLLNYPLGWMGFAWCAQYKVQLFPGVIPWVVANSLLWSALSLTACWGILRIRRYRRSVLQE